MKLHRVVLPFIFLTLATVLTCAIKASNAAHAQHERNGFTGQANHAIQCLAKGKLKDFIRLAADDGIMVVRREIDRAVMKKETQPLNEPSLPTKMQHGSGAKFTLGKQNAIARKEIELSYDKNELSQSNFANIFKQFQFFVNEAYGAETSLNLKRSGDGNFVGPAVQGKMASNYFWRCYFVQQHGTWRIWKMEVEYTH